MNRREFLEMGALAALGAAAGCKTALCGGFAVNGIRIGVQMWSVNDLWKSDPADAFRRLKALGYDGVQSFGFSPWTMPSSRRCLTTTRSG